MVPPLRMRDAVHIVQAAVESIATRTRTSHACGVLDLERPRNVQVMEEYMACLKQHGSVAEQCRPLAQRYFECRMERWAPFVSIVHPLHCRLPDSASGVFAAEVVTLTEGGKHGMRRDLMAKQNLKDLGFREPDKQ